MLNKISLVKITEARRTILNILFMESNSKLLNYFVCNIENYDILMNTQGKELTVIEFIILLSCHFICMICFLKVLRQVS